jgi:phosphoenolpyruvate phosphomutase
VVIARTSHKPVICDCETGFGEVRNLRRMVCEFEHAGMAGICIEDKRQPKRNSFLPGHRLADRFEFAAKIQTAKETQSTPDFVVLARLESLIAGTGMRDALRRGKLYAQAGADALVVHSKADTACEVLEFAARWHELGGTTPLVVIPTTYYSVHRSELSDAGIGAVIYANQALRAAARAMRSVLEDIVQLGTSAPLEQHLAPVAELFDITDEENVQQLDLRFRTAAEELRRQHASRLAVKAPA